jgi:hypothetical protein
VGVSKMKSYLVAITEAWQTPAVVYEVRKRAAIEPLQVLLEHAEEPNVVRGRNQPFEGKGFQEIRRPDGGLSWYHPKTFCFILGVPSKHPRRVARFQEAWGELLKEMLFVKGYERASLVYRDSDLYFKNGGPERQLMGMSGWISREGSVDVRVQRACWYEQDPLRDIGALLRADGIDPAEFRRNFVLVKRGFFAGLMQSLTAKEVDVYDFVSDESIKLAGLLQKAPGGPLRGSCIMGRTE